MDNKVESLCKVCGDKASGKHYGVPSCDGCRGFFKRSIRRGLAYHCKESGSCIVDVTRRNQCQACRFKKCLAVNMKRDAVQHERAPRASLGSSQCPTIGGARRHGYGFPAHGTFLGPTAPLVDVPAYHLIYPQPTFPFHFGVKPHGLGLPGGFGLGIFNCPSQLSSSTLRTQHETLHIPSYFQPFKNSIDNRLSTDGRATNVTSIKPAEEDEVTSSEEARDIRKFCRTYSQEQNPIEISISDGPTNDITETYESAAKLLFLTVKWAKTAPSFLQLSFRDQTALLRNSWSELFVLSAAQHDLPVDEDALLSGTPLTADKIEAIKKEAQKLKETIARFKSMNVDLTEYACLKALTLFKPEAAGLNDRNQVEILQEQTHVMLHDYCKSQNLHKTRFGKLLMLLTSASVLSKDLIEDLLFRKSIGHVKIDKMLANMLKDNDDEDD